MGADYRAIDGTRTYAEQDVLFRKGRATAGSKVTNARGGYSNHNFGVALDCGCFDGGEYLDNSDFNRAAKIHAAIGQIAARYGIEWGWELDLV